MVEKLAFWLESIFEDDPLPDEITKLVFEIKYNGKYRYLSLKGYEKEINPNIITFFPLEAQFFSCNELMGLDIKTFVYRIEYIIEKAFSSNILKILLKNILIYIKHNDKIKFLFKV